LAEKRLKRSLGLWACIAGASGMVVASTTLVTLGQGFGIAGPGFIIAMVVAMLLNLLVAFSFAELSSMIPRAGGINNYTLAALGPFAGLMSVFAGYILVNIFSGAAETTIPGIVFSEVFAPWMDPKLFSIVLLAVLTLVNIRGIECYAWLQMGLTGIMMITLFIVGIVGTSGLGIGEPVTTSFDSFNIMGWSVLGLTALAFWLFLGLEFITPLAEEIRNPRINIPLAMFLSLLIIFVVKIFFGIGALRYVPMEVLAGSPAPHVEAGMAILGRSGQIYMGIITMLASLSSLNTLCAAIPRMIYGLAMEGQAPKIFSKLSRWQTPWVAILFNGIIIAIPVLFGIATVESIVIFILAGVFCYFITYIIAHLDVIILRYRYPDVQRPFRSPFGIAPQVIGILSMVYMMFNIFPDPDIKRIIYRYALLFIAIAIVYSAAWVKFVMKKGLFERTPLENLIADLEENAEAKSIAETKSASV